MQRTTFANEQAFADKINYFYRRLILRTLLVDVILCSAMCLSVMLIGLKLT